MDPNEKLGEGLETMAGDIAALKASEETEKNAVGVPQIEKTPEPSLETLHTYQSDIAELMDKDRGSIVKIAAAEQAKRQEERKSAPAKSSNLGLAIGGIFIILIGLGGGGYLIYKKISTQPVVQTPQLQIPSFINVENQDAVPIDGLSADAIKTTIGTLVSQEVVRSGTITQLYPTIGDGAAKQLVATGDFFYDIGSTMPRILAQSFDSAMLFGVFRKDSVSTPFILLHTSSYTTAFAGMLTWEPTMFDDLYKMFDINPSNGGDLFHATFSDKIIKNQDARAIVDANGNPVLFYAFLGEHKDMLIITTSDVTLTEALNRLSIVRTAQ